MRRKLTLTFLIPLALVAMAFAMVATARDQRTVAARAAERTATANRLLLGMLDQETGLRGYLLSGREAFLAPFHAGEREGREAEVAVRSAGRGDAATMALLDRFASRQTSWRVLAQNAVAARRNDPGDRGSIKDALVRKGIMDDLRRIVSALERRLDQRREQDLAAAGRRAVAFVVLLTFLLGAAAYGLLASETRQRRRAFRSELAYRKKQRELADVIQVVRSEPEAHGLLKRHLELAVPGVRATILQRNNSDNRLEPSTEVEAAGPLAARLVGAEPASCLAIRLGRGHRELTGDEPLLTCRLCGRTPGGSACEPLLVSGQVIGSVLVEHADVLDEGGERLLADSVAQAAPVLANLRNLALAERQASTDALTGLPNRRSVEDAVRRMAAQAIRTGAPLAAIGLDLDHFKDINDRFGHEMGDTVLAHVGTLLAATVRTSDLVGRIGGEEFVVLAPDTDVAGALLLAEKVRAALAEQRVPGLARDVTGSLGVAVLPDHAATATVLLRLADRALYAAKNGGRNRVELVADATAALV